MLPREKTIANEGVAWTGETVDSDTAFHVLNSIVGVCASIGGFLVVAAVFFLVQQRNYSSSYEWMKHRKGMQRTYLGIWVYEAGWFFFGFLIPFFFALGIVVEGVSLTTQVPGGNAAVVAQLASDVNHLVGLFDLFIVVVVLTIPVWILMAIFFPSLSEYYTNLGDTFDQMMRLSPGLLLEEAGSFLKNKPGQMSKIDDVEKWANLEYSKGDQSDFYRYLKSRVSDRFDGLQKEKNRLFVWRQIAFAGFMVGYIVIWFSVWSIL